MLDQARKSFSDPNSYNICCPFCENLIGKTDTSFHLNFNTAKGVFRCARCNASGKLSKLKGFELYEKPKAPPSLNQLKSKFELFKKKGQDTIDLSEFSIPLDPHETPIAYDYLLKRGLSVEDMRTYQLRVGMPYWDTERDFEVKKWCGRILFPFLRGGKCFYVIGRTYTEAEPRYLNSQGSKLHAIYNLDQVNGQCILCEGIFSSISAQKIIGIPAIAILGKTINAYQASLIRYRCHEIFLSLDGDTERREKMAMANLLRKMGLKVWVIDLPVIHQDSKKLKDPDDFKDRYSEFFKKAECQNMF